MPTSSIRGGAWTRRGALGLFTAGAACAVLPANAVPTPGADGLVFRIMRGSDEIGEHRVTLRRRDDRTVEVRTDIDVEVKFALLTVYSFHQRVASLWRDGRMVAAEIRIDDQGEVRELTVSEEGDGLLVRSSAGRRHIPAGTVTDIDFWTPEITRRDQVLDSSTGELVPLETRPGPVERLDLGSLTVRARRFSLRANRGRSGVVWYTDDGTWVRGRLRTRGEELDYLPRELPLIAQSGQT